MYYLIRHGKPVGPFTIEEMKEMDLSGTDFVKQEGWDDYKELREVAGLSQTLGIRFERALPQYYAGLDVRLLAAAIDYLFALLIFGCIALAIVLKADDTQERLSGILGAMVLIPLLKFILCVVGEGSSKQASPGKLLLQIRVTDTKGNPIGFWQALWRNIAKLSGVLTLGIGYLVGFFHPKQQCLHDRLAGTWVIKGRLL